MRNIKILRFYTVLVLLSTSFCFNQVLYASENWVRKVNKNGVKVYLRKVEGSSVKEFKGTIELEGTLESALAIFDDIQACTEWLYGCKNPVELERINFFKRYVHHVNKPPFIATRDYIFLVTVVISQDKKSATINLESRSKKIPVGQHVRVEKANGSYHIEEVGEGKLKLTWQQHLEPGGSVNGFFVNLLLKDIPFNSLKDFRKLIRKDKYKNAQFILSNNGLVNGIRYSQE